MPLGFSPCDRVLGYPRFHPFSASLLPVPLLHPRRPLTTNYRLLFWFGSRECLKDAALYEKEARSVVGSGGRAPTMIVVVLIGAVISPRRFGRELLLFVQITFTYTWWLSLSSRSPVLFIIWEIMRQCGYLEGFLSC